MGIKLIGGKPYLYRTYRVGDRVRSQYIGPGYLAPVYAQRDAERKAARAESRRIAEEQEAAMAEWFRRSERIVALYLTAAGCRQHNRQWMRPRTMNSIAVEPAKSQAPSPAELSPESRAVLARVEAGDKTITTAQAARLLREKPELIDSGNLSDAVVFTLANRVYREDNYGRQVMIAQADRVRDELAGDSPSPIERLLASRAAACWLETHTLEIAANHSGKVDRLTLHRIESANRRFLAAVKTLARVRKLALPDLKVTFDGRAVYIDGRRFGVTPDGGYPRPATLPLPDDARRTPDRGRRRCPSGT